MQEPDHRSNPSSSDAAGRSERGSTLPPDAPRNDTSGGRAHDAPSAPGFETIDEPRYAGATQPQWALVTLIAVFTVGSLLYRALFAHNLGHTAALFIGLPAVCAILLALSPTAQTATGAILKGLTLVLLVLAPLLGEGWLCIVIASPLFYLVGVLVGLGVDYARERRERTTVCLGLLVLLPASLEGVVPGWTVNRTTTVEARRVVDAPAEAVAARLAGGMDVRVPRPLLLRFGFPAPLRSWGNGLAIGSEHGIHFAGAEGDPAGDLHLRVAASAPGYVRLEALEDRSKLLQWTRWQTSEVRWTAVDATHTLVVSRLTYQRELDPAWYFGPLERLAARGAADYLIRSNADPNPPRTLP